MTPFAQRRARWTNGGVKIFPFFCGRQLYVSQLNDKHAASYRKCDEKCFFWGRYWEKHFSSQFIFRHFFLNHQTTTFWCIGLSWRNQMVFIFDQNISSIYWAHKPKYNIISKHFPHFISVWMLIINNAYFIYLFTHLPIIMVYLPYFTTVRHTDLLQT